MAEIWDVPETINRHKKSKELTKLEYATIHIHAAQISNGNAGVDPIWSVHEANRIFKRMSGLNRGGLVWMIWTPKLKLRMEDLGIFYLLMVLIQ